MKNKILGLMFLILIGYAFSATEQISTCRNLNVTGTTYNLTSALSTTGNCFTVSAPNIILEMNGLTITGNNNLSIYAINVSSGSFTIKNGLMKNFSNFITFSSNSDNSTVLNMTFRDSPAVATQNITVISLFSNNISIINSSFTNLTGGTGNTGADGDYGFSGGSPGLPGSMGGRINTIIGVSSNNTIIGNIFSNLTGGTGGNGGTGGSSGPGNPGIGGNGGSGGSGGLVLLINLSTNNNISVNTFSNILSGIGGSGGGGGNGGSEASPGIGGIGGAGGMSGHIYGMFLSYNNSISSNIFYNLTSNTPGSGGGGGFGRQVAGGVGGIGGSGGSIYGVYAETNNNLTSNSFSLFIGIIGKNGSAGGGSYFGSPGAGGAGGNGSSIFAININQSNRIRSNNITVITSGARGFGYGTGINGTSGLPYGFYIRSQSNLFISNRNQLDQITRNDSWYSNTAQDISSSANLGWFPLYKTNGSTAINQNNTSFYNVTSGLNANLTTNVSLTYWYSGLEPLISSSTILPATLYVSSTVLGYCSATSPDETALSYNYTFFKNGAVNVTGSIGTFASGISANVGNITGPLTAGQSWVLQCLAYNANGVSALLNSSASPVLSVPTAYITTAVQSYNRSHVTYNFTALVLNGADAYTNANISLLTNGTIINSKLANLSINGFDTTLTGTWLVQRSRVDSSFLATTRVESGGMSVNNSANITLPIYAS